VKHLSTKNVKIKRDSDSSGERIWISEGKNDIKSKCEIISIIYLLKSKMNKDYFFFIE